MQQQENGLITSLAAAENTLHDMLKEQAGTPLFYLRY